MQKKLTVLFAFAIFMLLIGWAITPAQANPPDQNGKHNHGGGGGGSDTGFEPAFVDLAGDMLTMDLPVSVSRDSSKKIHFATDFVQDIVMDFQIPPLPKDNDCFAVPETAADSGDIIQFVEELNGNSIASGRFVVEVDRRKKTGGLLIQYSGELGFTYIQFRGPYVDSPPMVIEHDPVDGPITFHFGGTITVWQVGEHMPDDKIVACPLQLVDVILYQ